MLSHQTCLLVHTHAYQDPSAHIFILSLSSNATKSFLFSVMIKKPNKDPIKCCNNAVTNKCIKTSPPCIIMRSRPPPSPFPVSHENSKTQKGKKLLLPPPPLLGGGGGGLGKSREWAVALYDQLFVAALLLYVVVFCCCFLSNLTGLHQTKI